MQTIVTKGDDETLRVSEAGLPRYLGESSYLTVSAILVPHQDSWADIVP